MGQAVERCAMCGRALQPHGFYVVRMDVFADPAPPEDLADEIDADGDAINEMASLIAQMSGMTADELQDDVHRRFEYRICRPCQRGVLANPLGLPRRWAPAPTN